MALIHGKVSSAVPFVTCALFLGDDARGICDTRTPRHRGAVQVGRRILERSLAPAPACAGARGRGSDGGAGLPPGFEGHLIGGLVISTRSRLLHRRTPARPGRVRSSAAVIYNSTRFEQHAARVSHRSADTLPNRAPRWQFRRAERAGTQTRSASSSRSRSPQGNQRHLRPRGRRAGVRAVAPCCGRRSRERCVRALCRRRVHRCAVGLHPRRGASGGRVADAVALSFEPRPGVRVALSDQRGPAASGGRRPVRGAAAGGRRAMYATSGPPLTELQRTSLARRSAPKIRNWNLELDWIWNAGPNSKFKFSIPNFAIGLLNASEDAHSERPEIAVTTSCRRLSSWGACDLRAGSPSTGAPGRASSAWK